MYARQSARSSQKYPDRQNSGNTPMFTPRSLKMLAARRILSLFASMSGTSAWILASPTESFDSSSQ